MKEPLTMNSQVLLPAPQRGGDSTQAVLLVRMQTQRRHTLNRLAAPERDVTTHLAQQPLDRDSPPFTQVPWDTYCVPGATTAANNTHSASLAPGPGAGTLGSEVLPSTWESLN